MAPVFRLREAGAVRAAYHLAIEMLGSCCPEAARILEEGEPDALAYLDFPASHWKRLRTNNVQERANREIRRRSRVVQVFPSTASLERLAGAVMCDMDEAWADARYFSEEKMSELYDESSQPRTFSETGRCACPYIYNGTAHIIQSSPLIALREHVRKYEISEPSVVLVA